MKKLIRNYPYLSVLTFGILSGTLWRIELEYHGWEISNWFSYVHYAIPVGFLLFMLWLNLSISLSLKKSIAFNLFSATTALVLFCWLAFAANRGHYGSPFPRFSPFSIPWIGEAYEYSILFIPTVFALLVISFLRLFKIKRSYWRVLLFTLAIETSFLFAILLLEITNHRGGADDIHALKSGFIIPFLFLSLGILVVKRTPIPVYE